MNDPLRLYVQTDAYLTSEGEKAIGDPVSGRYSYPAIQSSAYLSDQQPGVSAAGRAVAVASDAVAGNNCRKNFLPLVPWRTMPRAETCSAASLRILISAPPFNGAGGLAAPQLHYRAMDAGDAGRAANARSERTDSE